MFIPFLMLISILIFIFYLIVLIDAITRKFKEDVEKIVWVLVILLTNFIGALIYYFIVYRKYKSLKWLWITLLVIFVILILFFFSIYAFTFSRIG